MTSEISSDSAGSWGTLRLGIISSPPTQPMKLRRSYALSAGAACLITAILTALLVLFLYSQSIYIAISDCSAKGGVYYLSQTGFGQCHLYSGKVVSLQP